MSTALQSPASSQRRGGKASKSSKLSREDRIRLNEEYARARQVAKKYILPGVAALIALTFALFWAKYGLFGSPAPAPTPLSTKKQAPGKKPVTPPPPPSSSSSQPSSSSSSSSSSSTGKQAAADAPQIDVTDLLKRFAGNKVDEDGKPVMSDGQTEQLAQFMLEQLQRWTNGESSEAKFEFNSGDASTDNVQQEAADGAAAAAAAAAAAQAPVGGEFKEHLKAMVDAGADMDMDADL
ncbi:hypothetical protein RI367_005538 [Sorochytrium milnesiophthora]